MTESDREPDLTDPWDIPPWELPGNCRADATPHRAALLRRLGNVGFILALASLYPCLGFCLTIGVSLSGVIEQHLLGLFLTVPAVGIGLIAVIVGIITAALAREEQATMRRGLVDPSGQLETEFARQRAVIGILIGLASALVWGFLAASGALGL